MSEEMATVEAQPTVREIWWDQLRGAVLNHAGDVTFKAWIAVGDAPLISVRAEDQTFEISPKEALELLEDLVGLLRSADCPSRKLAIAVARLAEAVATAINLSFSHRGRG